MTVRNVAVTGVAVLAGFTRISDPFTNFHNIWQGSTTNPNALRQTLQMSAGLTLSTSLEK